MFAARDTRTAAVAAGLSAVLVSVLYGSTFLAAAHLRVVLPGRSDPQRAVPQMIIAWLPQVLRGMGLAVLFAAALTTLGGVWSAMTAMVAADFGWVGAKAVRTQRLLIVAVATVSLLGGVFLVDDILNRLILELAA